MVKVNLFRFERNFSPAFEVESSKSFKIFVLIRLAKAVPLLRGLVAHVNGADFYPG